MEVMEAEAAHQILVISDSDVRVTPDYLRAVALPFAEERVGAMCCPYRGVAAEGGRLWARLEAVGMSVEMTAGVLVARKPWKGCSLCWGRPWPSGARPSGGWAGSG